MRRLNVVLELLAALALAVLVIADAAMARSPQMIGPNLSIERPKAPGGAAAVACPCSDPDNVNSSPFTFDPAYVMTTEAIDAITAACTGSVTASCPVTYSVNYFCDTGGPVQNLGYWQMQPGSGECLISYNDPFSGSPVVGTVSGLTTAEEDACIAEIVATADYPGICPTP